MSDKKKRQ